MSRYYDIDGQPLTLYQWAAMYETDEARRVGSDERDGIHVSTVLLGIDHNFGSDGPPLIFETMIFGGEHSEYQERYSTLEQAKEGHRHACELAFGVPA